MARQKLTPNTKKFGMPLYASAWVDGRTVLVAGGGGKKSSGIPNRVCVATFDGDTLSDPLFVCHTDETAPQALVMFPDASRVLCVFGGDVAVYDVSPNPDADGSESNQLGEDEVSDPPPEANSAAAKTPCIIAPARLAADGTAFRSQIASCDIKCAAFSSCGGKLAVGLEDGRVALCEFENGDDKTSSLKLTTTIGKHSDSVTSLSFSRDDKLLVTTSSESAVSHDGAVVWSLATNEKVTALSPSALVENAVAKSRKKKARHQKTIASYRHCRFDNSSYGIVTVLNIDGEGFVMQWQHDVSSNNWTAVRSARATRDPISSAATSPDGQAVACGTAEGAVVVVDVQKLKVMTTDKNAHMIFVTTMAFSVDSQFLVSGSADASARGAVARKVSPVAAIARIVVALALLVLVTLFLTVFMRRGGVAGLLGGEDTRTGAGGITSDAMGGVDVADAAAQAKEELARMTEAAARRAAEAGASVPDPTPQPVVQVDLPEMTGAEEVVEEVVEEPVEEPAEEPAEESVADYAEDYAEEVVEAVEPIDDAPIDDAPSDEL
jgi:prolactin regulatory element-binding protein|tara:strand:+ start:829 stop:2481 length:1653 start_codon:yes stop_codon:yes gene_type:complete